MTSYNTRNQSVGLSGDIALASEQNNGRTDQIVFMRLLNNFAIINIVCRITGYQDGWCELGHNDDIISYDIYGTNDTNTQWIVEYITNVSNSSNISSNSNSSETNNSNNSNKSQSTASNYSRGIILSQIFWMICHFNCD